MEENEKLEPVTEMIDTVPETDEHDEELQTAAQEVRVPVQVVLTSTGLVFAETTQDLAGYEDAETLSIAAEDVPAYVHTVYDPFRTFLRQLQNGMQQASKLMESGETDKAKELVYNLAAICEKSNVYQETETMQFCSFAIPPQLYLYTNHVHPTKRLQMADPVVMAIYTLQAQFLLRDGDHKAARKAVKKAMALNPADAALIYLCAETYKKAGYPQSYLDKIKEAAPYLFTVEMLSTHLMYIADYFMVKGSAQIALQYLLASIFYNPKNESAKKMLAAVANKAGIDMTALEGKQPDWQAIARFDRENQIVSVIPKENMQTLAGVIKNLQETKKDPRTLSMLVAMIQRYQQVLQARRG